MDRTANFGIRTETRQINGRDYSVTQVAGADGLKAYKLFMKVVLPVVGAAFDCSTEKGRFKDLADQVVHGVTGSDGEALERLLFVSVQVDGRPMSAAHWPGHYQDYHQLLAFALELNFREVFQGAAGRVDEVSQRLIGMLSGLQSRLSTLSQKSPGSSPAESAPPPKSEDSA